MWGKKKKLQHDWIHFAVHPSEQRNESGEAGRRRRAAFFAREKAQRWRKGRMHKGGKRKRKMRDAVMFSFCFLNFLLRGLMNNLAAVGIADSSPPPTSPSSSFLLLLGIKWAAFLIFHPKHLRRHATVSLYLRARWRRRSRGGRREGGGEGRWAEGWGGKRKKRNWLKEKPPICCSPWSQPGVSPSD